MRTPCAEPSIAYRSTAKVSVPRAASASPTCAVAFPRPIGPRTVSISHVEREDVARLDDALEAAVVDPGEERDLAAVLLLDEHRDRARLRHRLDDQHAGHHRPLGKVAREPPVVRVHARGATTRGPARAPSPRR